MSRMARLAVFTLIVIGLSFPAMVQSKEKKISALDLYLKVGARFDSNVRLEALDEDQFADDEDNAGVIYFSGNYRFLNSNKYELSAGYSHYQTLYKDIDSYDLMGSIGHIRGKYRWRAFILGLTYQPSYYWVGYDRYILYHKIKPEVMWNVRDNLATRASYTYSQNDNFREDGRDGHTDVFMLDVYYTFSKRGYLFGGGGYEINYADHDDYDYTKLRTKLGLSLGLPWKLKMVATGRWDRKRYDNIDSTHNIKRLDDKYKLSLAFFRPVFYDWLALVFDYAYTYNDTNINNFEYDKNEVTLSVTARY